jgi:hypothetical protein
VTFRSRVSQSQPFFDMLLSRPAALLFFFSSLPVRWWARSDDGGREGEPGLQAGIPIRRSKDPEEGRWLQRTVSDSGNTTTGAAPPYGLSFCTTERNVENCNVGCPSKFYTVVGTGGNMTASTCGGATWDTILYVRAGSTSSPCSKLTCTGMYLIQPPSRLCGSLALHS